MTDRRTIEPMTATLLVLNGVRVWVQALRRRHCPIWGLHHLLRSQGAAAGLQPFHAFLWNVCANAGRTLEFSPVGCADLSADEDAILVAVTQCQQGNTADVERALLHLMPAPALPRATAPLAALSAHLSAAGHCVLHANGLPWERATLH